MVVRHSLVLRDGRVFLVVYNESYELMILEKRSTGYDETEMPADLEEFHSLHAIGSGAPKRSMSP